ncbi:hypothetical protein PYW08_011631 [Mythimna loreyi]|uniref:Uncharacterized protein n=1 Tax=Mythimna loreyi TaxID=667449 RepID=A0ACC2QKG9_9NEOP|nr:hypothetical protein PYW08_011631 [Mythimna loreyi]
MSVLKKIKISTSALVLPKVRYVEHKQALWPDATLRRTSRGLIQNSYVRAGQAGTRHWQPRPAPVLVGSPPCATEELSHRELVASLNGPASCRFVLLVVDVCYVIISSLSTPLYTHLATARGHTTGTYPDGCPGLRTVDPKTPKLLL